MSQNRSSAVMQRAEAITVGQNKLAKDATEIGKKLDGLGIICDRVERSLKA